MRLVLLAATLAGCASAMPVTDLPLGDPARRDRQVPVVLDAITDTATGRTLTPGELAARLAGVQLVFVGESHDDPHAHEAQRRLIEALADSGRRVLVGLEMLPTGEQAALDFWIDGGSDEEDFLRLSGWYRHWGHSFGYYRDIFLLARARGLRMFGVNIPREVVTAARKKGLDKLTPEEAALLPARVDTGSAEHQRLFRAYMGDGGHGEMTEAQWQGMYRAQCTWDAAMAHHALQALRAHGGIMVVLVGAGHVAFGLGAQRQAALWFDGPMASVIPVEAGGRVRASYADYVWGIPPEPKVSPFPDLGAMLADRKGEPHPLVMAVEAESPLGRAGLRADDRVLALDGADVADKETLLRMFGRKRWGDGVALTVRRGTETRTISAPLRRPAD